jgi:hypothetical protein
LTELLEKTAGNSQLWLHRITAKPKHLDFKDRKRLEAQEMKFIRTVVGAQK